MKRLVCLLAVLLPLGVLAAESKDSKPAAPAPQAPKAQPGVNWEGQVLKATGSGAPDLKASTPAQARLGAETAAKLDAFRNLLAQAKGIRVSADKTVGDAMTTDEVKARVEGAIRGFKVTAKRYFSDSGVEMDVEVPLSALTELVAAPAESKAALNTTGELKNTGLVVDARGLKVEKALSPRLLDGEGKPVYGIDTLSEDARKSKGVASYFATLDAAKKSLLVGDKPLVIKASKVQGTDLVLSADDLKRLSESNNAYLSEGRVAIIAN
ncbi:MAG TPA: hypothetical protein VND93_05675 [Myxococcales bacterium]|nr:hypothetical protein [Myxococcales bacterium]